MPGVEPRHTLRSQSVYISSNDIPSGGKLPAYEARSSQQGQDPRLNKQDPRQGQKEPRPGDSRESGFPIFTNFNK